jgi:hypothetical protein
MFRGVRVSESARVLMPLWAGFALLAACVWMPFRWTSCGETAAFLATAGLRVGVLRRVELLTGLALGVAMIASGLVPHPKAGLSWGFWVAYAGPVASALLLANREQLRSRRLRGARARDLFLTFAVLAVGLLLVVWLVLKSFQGTDASERSGIVLGSLLVALLAIYCATSIFLWIRAFIRAGDEEALRRVELDTAIAA